MCLVHRVGNDQRKQDRGNEREDGMPEEGMASCTSRLLEQLVVALLAAVQSGICLVDLANPYGAIEEDGEPADLGKELDLEDLKDRLRQDT